MLTATALGTIPDRRHMRAQVITHHVLHALEPWIDRLERLERWRASETSVDDDRRPVPRARKEIYEALFALLYATGAEIITDSDRAVAGLAPRNERGMTEQELQIMESRLLEALLSPRPPVIMPDAAS